MQLKSDGGVTKRFPISDRRENEMAIEVHCDAWRNLTKGWGKAKIGIRGFIREKG